MHENSLQRIGKIAARGCAQEEDVLVADPESLLNSIQCCNRENLMEALKDIKSRTHKEVSRSFR